MALTVVEPTSRPTRNCCIAFSSVKECGLEKQVASSALHSRESRAPDGGQYQTASPAARIAAGRIAAAPSRPVPLATGDASCRLLCGNGDTSPAAISAVLLH